MWQSNSMTLGRIGCGIILWIFGAIVPVYADKPAPMFDDGQKAIVTAVTDKLVADILAIKKDYPELEHFGEAPWFTRGFGEFRYEYKLNDTKTYSNKIESLPGGLGLHFCMTPEGDPSWTPITAYDGNDSTGSRAGINYKISMTNDGPREKLKDALFGSFNLPLCCPTIDEPGRGIIGAEFDPLFAKLSAEYLLKRKGIEMNVAGLLEAFKSADPTVSENALLALRSQSLSPQELDSLASPPRVKNLLETARTLFPLLKEHGGASIPTACLFFTKLALLAEKEGTGELAPPSPYDDPHAGEARQTRREMLGEIESGDERFAETASLILGQDPVGENRRIVLDYFAKLSAPRGKIEIIRALQNPYRSVQRHAAELSGEKGFSEARDNLKGLLNSPSAKVRESARLALGKLGFPSESAFSPGKLPDSVVHIAATLRNRGLTDSDIVRICAKPMPSLHPFSPPDSEPRQSELPPGTSVKEWEPSRGNSANGETLVIRNWQISLTDPWRISKLDRPSVDKRSLQYAAGFGLDHSSALDPTGPFLLAGAVKVKNFEAAQRVYERMCDEFDTDDEILYRGITGLAWERFQMALNQYWQKHDAKALQYFQSVTRLKEFSKPSSLLGDYIQQSAFLSAGIQRRQKEKVGPAPELAKKAAYLDYWIGQIKEINGVMPGQPASPFLWYSLIEKYRMASPSHPPYPPFATDKLRAVGLPALPKLFEAIEDKTPTRTIAYWRDFWPLRRVVSVGSAAREVFEVVCDDYGLTPPEFLNGRPDGSHPPMTPALRAEFSNWFEKIPTNTMKLSPEARERLIPEPEK